MRRIVLTFGLLAGALLATLMLVSFQFVDEIGFDHGQTLGYATMVLAFLFVFFGIRSYRDTVAGGTIGFGRAVKVGLLITVVACACYVAAWLVYYYTFGAGDFMERYAAHTLEKARAAGATAEQLAARAREMARFRELYRNPLVNAAITFLEAFPVGLIMTLVSAGILRRPARRANPVATGSRSLVA